MAANKQILILFQDDSYMVFNKPANLLTIPTPAGETNTLTHIVNEQYAHDQTWRLHPCHRLDQETSGVIIYAKGKKAQQMMMDLFKAQKIEKHYIALVQGQLKQPAGQIKSRIKNLEDRHFRQSSDGKVAITRYQVLQQFNEFAIVLVELLTGRTNQIRIQFSDLGHPLLGDRKYGRGRDFTVRFRRSALHAAYVKFDHPQSGTQVSLCAPLPEDMVQLLEKYHSNIEVSSSLFKEEGSC